MNENICLRRKRNGLPSAASLLALIVIGLVCVIGAGLVRAQQCNFAGAYTASTGSLRITGSTASETWATGGRNGKNDWSDCSVNGKTMTCNWTGTYEGDPDKTADRKGTLTATLDGASLSVTYNEDEPIFHWNVSPYPSGIHKGAIWHATFTRDGGAQPCEPVAPSTKVSANGVRATVGSIKGDVSVRSPGGTFEDLTTNGRQLGEGDDVSTGPDGEVTLTFSDGSTVTLEPNTQCNLGSLLSQRNNARIRINLMIGKVAARIAKTVTATPAFSVRSPNAVASVRGTVFTVEYDRQTQTTTVTVEEGTVEVASDNSRAVAVNAGRQVQVAQSRLGPVTGSTGRTGGIGASVSLSGRWIGNYTNSKGEAGKSTITINQLADGTITGDEDGWRIENGRRNGNSLTWQYLRQNNGCRDYQVDLQLSNDGRILTGTYQVTDRCASPSNYGGRYVSYQRQ